MPTLFVAGGEGHDEEAVLNCKPAGFVNNSFLVNK